MLFVLLLLIPAGAACRTGTPSDRRAVPAPPDSASGRPVLDGELRARLLADLAWLADDARAGRAAGTPGNAETRDWLAERFEEIGLEAIGEGYVRPFETPRIRGANVVGRIAGSRGDGRAIVVTAHFDHLGVRNGQVYNGADDNASGTAALLAAAAWFSRHTAGHDLVFAALDAEERGLQGARAFMADPPISVDAIVVNVNMDMISRSDRGELYAAGTAHWPDLLGPLEQVAGSAPVTLVFGHDTPGSGSDDWTGQSDHAVFHEAGIPFVYFGVEDHEDYHRPTDDVARIVPEFFIGATETVLAAIVALDAMD